MTDDEKIRIAADYIHDEMNKRGSPIDPAHALKIARHLFDIWRERYEVRTVPAGEIAQHHRDRYIAPREPDEGKP